MAKVAATTTANSNGPDPELKRAFQELQMQTLTTRQKVRQIEQEIEQATRTNIGLRITCKTVESLPETQRVYESIGRAFVLRPGKNIVSKLNKQVEENTAKVGQLTQSKQYHENKVKESENNLRELVERKKKNFN